VLTRPNRYIHLTVIAAKEHHKGAQGEHFFEGYFLEKGIFIACPKHDLHRVDCVVEWEGRLVRVNVKTMARNGGTASRDSYTTNLTTRCPSGIRRYLPSEVDYFGIVNLAFEAIWMVPLSATKTQTLSWHPPTKAHRKHPRSFDWDSYRIKSIPDNVLQLS